MEHHNFSSLWFSPDQWTGLAYYYVSLPLFPVFQTVHFILTATALRGEKGSLLFAFKHPIASCVLTFVVASAGGILANLALARPPLESVVNGWNVLTCVLVWFLIFFSPLDLCYALTFFTPLRLVLLLVEELARAKKIFAGVTLAASVYPQCLLAMAVVGMFKGSGKRWSITLYRLSCDPHSTEQHELLQISFFTKAAFVCGAVYAFNQMNLVIDSHLLVLVCGIILMSTRVCLFFTSIVDPFSTPQMLSWKLATFLSLTPREVIQEQHRISAEATERRHKEQLLHSSKQKSD